jgi:NTE family protein
MERALILSGGGARGAFQAGVLKFLEEADWKPDIICGTSIGAINAVAAGCGMGADRLIHLWQTYNSRKLYRFGIQKFMLTLLSRRKFSPLTRTDPLREMLTAHLDIKALRRSKTEIIISAVHMLTSEITYFDHREIDIDHVMAAAALPMFFPWNVIEGQPYWDGGLMVNVPIMPALERGAKTIIVVLLSPAGICKQAMPKTHRHVAELIFEQFLIGSYRSLSPHLSREGVNIAVVGPTRNLGIRSLLDFSNTQSKLLIQEGYDNAKKQLKNFF